MKQLDDRTKANLDVVLEEVCRDLPNGGDYAFRKKIAQKLLSSARKGNTTLAGLNAVALQAVDENSQPKTTRTVA